MKKNPALFVLAFIVSALLAISCGPTYPNCKTDDHCSKSSEVCVNGQCQKCRDATQCKEGEEECVANRCEVKKPTLVKAGCSTDNDCGANAICFHGQCSKTCSTNTDCGSGEKCSNNYCIALNQCFSNNDCNANEICQSGMCTVPVASTDLIQVARNCSVERIHFDFNEATLSQNAISQLEKDFECLKAKIEVGMLKTIELEGHADERGTIEYNLALGEKRAQAAMNYLANRGIGKELLETLSKGENDPINPSNTEDAWSQNRRVEVKIKN